MPAKVVRTALFISILAPAIAVAALSPLSAEEKQPETVTAPATQKDIKAAPGIPPVPAATCHACLTGMPKGGTAIINFVAPITANTMADLAKNAQNAVISGADSIRVNISSPGGSVAAAQFGINVLKTLPVPVDTVAMSQIASAAVALFCAGEKRYMGDGASLYLHQQTSYREVQEKTAAALSKEFALSKLWYNTMLYNCIETDADRKQVDYSSRDVVIDVDQATALGMVTTPMDALRETKAWGMVMNVTAPDPRNLGSGYPSYR